MGSTTRNTVERLLGALATLAAPPSTRALSPPLGATPEGTARLMRAAVPLVLVALARRTATSQGADLLLARLRRAPRPGPDDEEALAREAETVLGSLLGGRRSHIEATLSAWAGLDRAAAHRVLALIVAALLKSLQEAGPGSSEDLRRMCRQVGAALSRAEDAVPGAVGAFEELLAEGETDEDPVRLGARLLASLTPDPSS